MKQNDDVYLDWDFNVVKNHKVTIMKNEPPLEDTSPVQFPQVGDFVDVEGEISMGLADGLHTLVITNIREEDDDVQVLYDCSTQDGEKDNIQIFPSEIIDWRKNP